ncbi:MAG: heat-inducible transcriptional repressor HrcA [Nitriliruptorales bacterium]|nr:heat-inducible transcriptional repressor HrcA [Nitriliruptorales bacterium]
MTDLDDTHQALDERRRVILHAVVTEYIADGHPVGSNRVVEVTGLDVSAATVRNEMAALEEMGYLTQPHTSAGRIPTDLGYRYFVNDLGQRAEQEGQQREVVQELLGSAHDVEDLLARTTHVLTQLTRLVSLVIAPAMDAARLRLVELLPMSASSAMLLMVTDTGRVDKRYITFDESVRPDDLDRVRGVLAEHVRGHRMAEVTDVLRRIVDEAPAELRGIVSSLVEATSANMVDDPVHKVFVGGRAALAGLGFEEEELSRVLGLLEEEVELARLLGIDDEDAGDTGPRVLIGEENQVEELQSAALVSQRYRLVSAGSVGVLGSTRMDYANVLSTVRSVADELQQTLATLDD